jgi:IS30 family transposase
MKPAGPAVAALLSTNLSPKQIADELGIHPATVYRNRRRLAITPQQVMERLATEAIPVRPTPTIRRDWTPDEQARHRAELLAALTEPTAA